MKSSDYTARRIDHPTSIHKQRRAFRAIFRMHDGEPSQMARLREKHVKKKMRSTVMGQLLGVDTEYLIYSRSLTDFLAIPSLSIFT